MISLTSEPITIDRIKVANNNKPDEENVRQLMSSIAAVGILQPIICYRPGTGLGICLVFGRDRLEACKRLKHRTILARVVNGTSAEIEEWIERAAHDENAVRRWVRPSGSPVVSLSEARRALQ